MWREYCELRFPYAHRRTKLLSMIVQKNAADQFIMYSGRPIEYTISVYFMQGEGYSSTIIMLRVHKVLTFANCILVHTQPHKYTVQSGDLVMAILTHIV